MVFVEVLAIVALVAFLMRLVVRAPPPVARTCAIYTHLRSFEYAEGWMSGACRGLAMRFYAFEGLDSDDHCIPPGLTISIVLNRPHFLHLARRDPEETSAAQDVRLDAPLLHDGPYRTPGPPSHDSGDRQVGARWSIDGAPADNLDKLLADPSMQSALLSFDRLEGVYMTLKDGVFVLHLIGADCGDAAFLTAGLDSAVRLAGVLGSRLPRFLTRDGANELDELDAHRAEKLLLASYRFNTILLTIAPALLVLARTAGLEGAPVGCLLIINAIATVFALSAVKERRKCGPLNSTVSVRLLRFVKVSWIAFALATASDLLANGGGS